MPVTDGLAWVFDDLQPVVATAVVGDVATEIHNPDVVVATETIVIHHHDLQHQVFGVETGNQELKRLVENWDKRVLLNLRFPLAESLALVYEIHLHVGVWREREGDREEKGGRGEREEGRGERGRERRGEEGRDRERGGGEKESWGERERERERGGERTLIDGTAVSTYI